MASGLRPDLIIRQVFTPAGAVLPTTPNPAVLIGVHRAFSYRASAGTFVGGQDNGDYSFPDLIDGSAVESLTATDTYLRPVVYVSNSYGVADVTDSVTFSDLENTSTAPSFAIDGSAVATFTVATGTTGSYDSTTSAFVDASGDFVSAGAGVGDIIEVDGVPAFDVTALVSDDELTVTRRSHGPSDARVRLGAKSSSGIRVLTYLGTTYDGFVTAGAKVGELINLDGWDERATSGGLTITTTGEDGLRLVTAASAFSNVRVGDVVLVKNDENVDMPAFVATSGGGPNSAYAANLPSTLSTAAVAGASGYPAKFFNTKRFTDATAPIGPRNDATYTAQDVNGQRTFTEAGYNFSGASIAAGDWVMVFKAYSGVVGNLNIGVTTITRLTGSWVTDGFTAGMAIMLLKPTNASNRQRVVIDTVTATVITLVAGTTLVADGDDDTAIVASQDFTPLFEVVSAANGSMVVTDIPNGVLEAAAYGGPLRYVVGRPADVTAAKSAGAFVSAVTSELRSIAWPVVLSGATLPTAGEFVFNDEGVLLFEVDSVVADDVTSVDINHTADTITRTGGTSFLTLGFYDGCYFSITSAADSGNDGIFKALTVTSTVITLDTTFDSGYALTAPNATDTAAVLQMVLVSDHAQAGVDLADTDVIHDAALQIRQSDVAQYSIVRLVSDTVAHVRHTVSGDEVTDTTITGMVCPITVNDEVEDATYTIEKTLTGATLDGDVLVTYAQRRRDHIDEFIEVTGSTLTEAAGPAVPGNPIGMAAAVAVANTGLPVYLLQVGDDTLAGWAAAREILKTTQVYALAPLTQDETQLTAFRTFVESESHATSGKREKILFQSHRFETQATRWTMSGAETAVYDNSGSGLTVVTTTGSGLVSLGARAGDVIEATYAGFVPSSGFVVGTFSTRVTLVAESGGTTTLTLLDSSSMPDTLAGGITLTAAVLKSKVLSGTSLRSAVAAYPGTIASRRVRNLYPDQALLTFDDTTNTADTTVGVYGGGEVTDYTIGGWLLCAAAAAMRAGLSPSAPMTGRNMTGFQRLVTPFTATSDLDIILDAGNYLLVQPAGENGGVQAVRALTTLTTDLLYMEDSVTVQADAFARSLRRNISPVLGSVVLSTAFFDLFSTIATAVMTNVMRNQELRDVKLLSFGEDPTRADTFLASFRVRPFLPANNGDIELVVGI